MLVWPACSVLPAVTGMELAEQSGDAGQHFADLLNWKVRCSPLQCFFCLQLSSRLQSTAIGHSCFLLQAAPRAPS